jgi:hypothetical protein
VGALELPRLQLEAQGLRVRIDCTLADVPLAEPGAFPARGYPGLPPPID